jgi:mannose-1-phosphate guanylyltransferase
MLQETVERLAPLVPRENILVITGAPHAVLVARQLPDLPEDNIVIEPSPRGTGPAIGLGAALIVRKDPDAVMGSFAADHFVSDPEAFRRSVRLAADVARQGYLVTIGISPTYAETGYGYIRCGEEILSSLDLTALRVEEFKEKPDRETAERYVASGHYLWNASMFVWKASALLAEMQRLLPDVYEILLRIAADWNGPEREKTLERWWPQLRDVTIDHGIMEHAERVAVVPASFGWTDLGDWHSLAEMLAQADGDNVVLRGRHIAEDTRSTLVFGNNRTIATLGVENLVIVDTDDVVFICDRSRAQDVRKLVQRLKESGDQSLT